MKHIPSGVMVTATDSKSQTTNKKNAFLRITNHPKFKIWLNIKNI
jgi:protein subunit release factor A